MLLNSAEVSTVELAAVGSFSAPRVAVTTTESANVTGRSTTWTGPVPPTSTFAVSNPSNDTVSFDATTPASKLPLASVVTVDVPPSRAVTATVAPGITAPEISMTLPTVFDAARDCADGDGVD